MTMTIIRQWIAGLAFAVLMVIALVRTSDDIELTYEPSGDDAGPVVVQCLSDIQRLRSVHSSSRHHRVLEGQNVLTDRAEVDEPRRWDDRIGAGSDISRGIDDDCLRAEAQRSLEVIWWVAGSLLCAIIFAMARLRMPVPASWDQSDGLDARAFDRAPVDPTLVRYRARR